MKDYRNEWNLANVYRGDSYIFERLMRGEDYWEAEDGIVQYPSMPIGTEWKCHGKTTPPNQYGFHRADTVSHEGMLGFNAGGGYQRNGICTPIRRRLLDSFGIDLTKLGRMSGFAAPMSLASNWETKSAIELEFMTQLMFRDKVQVIVEPVVFAVGHMPGEELKRLLGGKWNEHVSPPIILPVSQGWFSVDYRDVIQKRRLEEPGFDAVKDMVGHKLDTTVRGVAWIARFSTRLKKFWVGMARMSNEEKKSLFGYRVENSRELFEIYKAYRKRSWELWQMDPMIEKTRG